MEFNFLITNDRLRNNKKKSVVFKIKLEWNQLEANER